MFHVSEALQTKAIHFARVTKISSRARTCVNTSLLLSFYPLTKNNPSPLTGLQVLTTLWVPLVPLASSVTPFTPLVGKINLTPQIAGGSRRESTPHLAWSEPPAFVHSLGRLPVGHGCLRRWRGHISAQVGGEWRLGQWLTISYPLCISETIQMPWSDLCFI